MELAGLEPATSWVRSARRARIMPICRVFGGRSPRGAPSGCAPIAGDYREFAPENRRSGANTRTGIKSSYGGSPVPPGRSGKCTSTTPERLSCSSASTKARGVAQALPTKSLSPGRPTETASAAKPGGHASTPASTLIPAGSRSCRVCRSRPPARNGAAECEGDRRARARRASPPLQGSSSSKRSGVPQADPRTAGRLVHRGQPLTGPIFVEARSRARDD
jgi:hypothetical protein